MMHVSDCNDQRTARILARQMRQSGWTLARPFQVVVTEFSIDPDSDAWDSSYMGEQVSRWAVTTSAPRLVAGHRRFIFRK